MEKDETYQREVVIHGEGEYEMGLLITCGEVPEA